MRQSICLLLLLATYSILQADDFSEFCIPEHRLRNLRLDLSAQSAPSKSNSYEISERNIDQSANGNLGGLWLYDSDALRQYLSLEFSSSGHYYDDKEEGYTIFHLDTKTKRMDERWSVTGDSRWYPWTIPIGFELNASISGEYCQEWYNYHNYYHSHYGNENGRETWEYFYNGSVSASFGFGRVRDATVVYDVYLLENRLRETGVLARPLSNSAREKLTALYYVQDEYDYVHDHSDKFFWQDVERILREDGALNNQTMDVYSIFRAVEGYLSNYTFGVNGYQVPARFLRQTGYFVGFEVNAAHEHTIERQSGYSSSTYMDYDTLRNDYSSYYQRVEYWNDPVLVGVRAEYHKPLGMRWQIDLGGHLMFPTKYIEDGFSVNSQANVGYLIADRIYINGFGEQLRFINERNSSTGKVCDNEWSVVYGGGINFYVEDHVQIGLNAFETQQVSYQPFWFYMPTQRVYERNAYIMLGVSYRFWGGLDIPGIVDPVRMLPWRH